MGNVISSLKLDLEELGLTEVSELLDTDDQNYPELNKQYFAQEIKKNMKTTSPYTNIDIELNKLLNRTSEISHEKSKEKQNKFDKPKERSKNSHFKDINVKPYINDQIIDKIRSSNLEFSDKYFPASVK